MTVRIILGWNAEKALKFAPPALSSDEELTVSETLLEYARVRNEKLFAIVDAAKGEVVLQKLAFPGTKYVSLYRGDAYEKHLSVSPILVECQKGSEFFTWLTKDVWGTGFAVFLTSSAELEQLVAHFRKLLTVVIETGDKLLFRFYDPKVLSAYLPTCNAAEIAHFFGRVETFLTEHDNKSVVLAFDPGQQTTGTFPLSGGPTDSLGRLIIREYQMKTLLGQSSQRVRKENLQVFRDQGFSVTEDVKTGDVILEDPGGGSARITSSPEEAVITTAEGRQWRVVYDKRNRIISLTDPGGLRIVFEHDQRGRLTQVRRGESQSYELVYEENGQLSGIKYPDGELVSLLFKAEKLIGFTDRNRKTTNCWYDYNGQLAEIVDPLGNRTRLTYSGWDSPSRISLPNGDYWSFEFDDEGHLKRLLENEKEVAVFDISDEDSTIDVKYGDGTFAHLVLEDGRVREATNESGTVKLDYDEHGRLVREEFNGRAVKYLRNPVGALMGIVTPEGDHLTFIRDKDHRVREILDWRGEAYLFDYHPNGAVASIASPNGVRTHQTNTVSGLPGGLQISSPTVSHELLTSRSWKYDQCDRLMDEAGGGITRHYNYDHDGRLLKVAIPGRLFHEYYDLDANGNRLRDQEFTCRYSGFNQLLQRGSDEFKYDGRGNMTTGHCPQGKADFKYNNRNQLVEVDTPEGKVSYAYDAFGRRISKQVGKKFTSYTWSGQHLLGETIRDHLGTERRDYLFFPEKPYPLAMRVNDKRYCLHPGRRSEPLCMTDERGEAVWKADYEAFGKALVSVEKVKQPFRLAGQYFDEETGLHYSLIRYYNPELGRFLSVDPLFAMGGSLNFYIYCDGDPLNRSDPTGEFIFVPILIGFAIGAVIGAGIEAYRQYNEKGQIDNGWDVARAALIGGAVGALGAGVGVAIQAGIGATSLAGIVGAGSLAGGVSSGVEHCVEATLIGKPIDATNLITDIAIGTAIGGVTAGVGGLLAKRSRRLAAGVVRKGAGKPWLGKLRGKNVELPGVRLRKIHYVKRSEAQHLRLRDEFNRVHRAKFMKSLANDPKKVAQLRAAGLKDAQIGAMRKGKVPSGYQVHHKIPIDDGGKNVPSNYVLIKNEPYHKVITNEQRHLVGGLAEGQSRDVNFPVPDGFVYPP